MGKCRWHLSAASLCNSTRVCDAWELTAGTTVSPSRGTCAGMAFREALSPAHLIFPTSRLFRETHTYSNARRLPKRYYRDFWASVTQWSGPLTLVRFGFPGVNKMANFDSFVKLKQSPIFRGKTVHWSWQLGPSTRIVRKSDAANTVGLVRHFPFFLNSQNFSR